MKEGRKTTVAQRMIANRAFIVKLHHRDRKREAAENAEREKEDLYMRLEFHCFLKNQLELKSKCEEKPIASASAASKSVNDGLAQQFRLSRSEKDGEEEEVEVEENMDFEFDPWVID